MRYNGHTKDTIIGCKSSQIPDMIDELKKNMERINGARYKFATRNVDSYMKIKIYDGDELKEELIEKIFPSLDSYSSFDIEFKGNDLLNFRMGSNPYVFSQRWDLFQENTRPINMAINQE